MILMSNGTHDNATEDGSDDKQERKSQHENEKKTEVDNEKDRSCSDRGDEPLVTNEKKHARVLSIERSNMLRDSKPTKRRICI